MPVRLILIRYRERILSYNQVIREIRGGCYWKNKIIIMGQAGVRRR